MRFRILVFTGVWIVMPALCQQSDSASSNVAGDQAMHNAIRSFDPSVKPMALPEKPARACAVRLIEMPVSNDIDTGMVASTNRLNPDADVRMIMRPPIPACPKDGEPARP